MATLPKTLMFRVDSGVAMFARKALWLTSPQHARAAVGMPHDAARAWPKEFASATEDGHTPYVRHRHSVAVTASPHRGSNMSAQGIALGLRRATPKSPEGA